MQKWRLQSWRERDDSTVKSTDCSSRGPEFNSQQPHGGSQLSVMGIRCPPLVCLKTVMVY
ncbi:mCG21386, isoform CRA_a [Mus musculus]|nr:mCG21386, isoform CRA_a [Mus musculus]EDL40600.1 mCG21386, isoform CRA_a [Mus musculus]